MTYLAKCIAELFVGQSVHQRVEARREKGHDVEAVLQLVDGLVPTQVETFFHRYE